MRHVVITDAAELPGIERQWSALLVRSGRMLLPLTHLWTTLWWQAFGHSRQARIHCFYMGERLVAVAPMLIESTRYRHVSIRQLASMANGHSPFSEPILDRDLTEAQILQIVEIIAASGGTDLTRFARIPEDSRLSRAFRSREKLGNRPVGLQPGMSTPLIRVDSDWETFFGKRSQKFRKSMRNKVNRFSKTAGCSIERIRMAAPDDPHIEDMLRVSKNSWKGKAGTDLGTMPGSLPFLLGLITRLGPAGGTQLWLARSGGVPIAYEFHASYGGVTYPLRADFDEAYRDIAPGSVVEFTALRDIFSDGTLSLYDSCANSYWYLSNWTAEFRSHVDIEIFDSSVKLRALHSTEYRLIPLLRRLRQSVRAAPPEQKEPPASH